MPVFVWVQRYIPESKRLPMETVGSLRRRTQKILNINEFLSLVK